MMDSEIQKGALISEARNELANRGMQFSEEYFLRYVKSGNADAVRLYLRAGISPNATLDGESALATSANNGSKHITELILDAGADPIGLLDGLKTGGTTRDIWDRLSSLSGVFTFVSTFLIAAVGWYFTSSYNERQLALSITQASQEQENKEYQNRVLEMQTVEKMIPHLTKDESSKQAALIAISTLASPTIAARIANTYGGQGSIDALTQIAKTDVTNSFAPAITALTNIASRESGSDKPAHLALASVLEGREKALVKISVEGNAVCNGFVVDGDRGWIVTPQYCFGSGISEGTSVTVQFADGRSLPVKHTNTSKNGLLAFLRLDTGSLYSLNLSSMRLPIGSAVSQIAFNLGTGSIVNRGELGVVIGTVVESGQISFPSSGQAGHDVSTAGLKVKLAVGEEALLGTAGGPLLDSEGNVACMTYMSDSAGNEQCLAASVISNALGKL